MGTLGYIIYTKINLTKYRSLHLTDLPTQTLFADKEQVASSHRAALCEMLFNRSRCLKWARQITPYRVFPSPVIGKVVREDMCFYTVCVLK